MKSKLGNMSFRNPVVATSLRRPGSSERLVGQDGDLNASNKKDLFVQMAAFLKQASETGAVTETTAKMIEEKASLRREALMSAMSSSHALAELGEVLAAELYQADNRNGFMRRFLARQELTQGQIPVIKMRLKDAVATRATGPSKVESQIVRDRTFYPGEFYITSRLFVEDREINQSVGDVLEEKYLEGLEGIMVAEDRTWLSLAKAQIGSPNDQTLVIGSFNPTSLSALRNKVTRWNLTAAHLLVANDLWNDFIGDSGFQQVIDPVSKHELLMTGLMGTLIGMSVISDAYRHEQHKVLSQGDILVISEAATHGQYTDRGGVNSQPIDGANEKVPGKGWMMSELMSMGIMNGRSVAIAKRT